MHFISGVLRPLHPWAHFFCAAKRNGRKKRPPGAAEDSSPLAVNREARLTRRAQTTRLGLDQESRFSDFLAARLGGVYGETIKNQQFLSAGLATMVS